MLGSPFKMPTSSQQRAARGSCRANRSRIPWRARWSKAPPFAAASAAPYLSTMCLGSSDSGRTERESASFAMESGRIVIVNLAKSKIGETAAHLMGALLIARVLAKLTTGNGQDFHLLIDEAHNFTSLALLLQEARKFKVSVTAVTQYLAALDPATRAALIGTARTHAYFRLGSEDAELIAPSLNREHQMYHPVGLQHLSRGLAVVRMPGSDAREIDVPTPAEVGGNPGAVIKQSRLHYGVRREVVERNIERVLASENRRGRAR
jgi:hypothetical protein